MTPAVGFAAELGSESFDHRFGGNRWSIETAFGASPPPALVLTLDLLDPRIQLTTDLLALPLCSRLDGETLERQTYTFDSAKRLVRFEGPAWHVVRAPESLLPLPLPERSLRLRTLRPEEDPEQTSNYEVHDTFV